MSELMEKRVVLGDEYDEVLWECLLDALRQLEAKKGSESHSLGGSQEMDSFDVLISGRKLRIESETYVGLSVRGPYDLVDKIVQMVREHTPQEARPKAPDD